MVSQEPLARDSWLGGGGNCGRGGELCWGVCAPHTCSPASPPGLRAEHIRGGFALWFLSGSPRRETGVTQGEAGCVLRVPPLWGEGRVFSQVTERESCSSPRRDVSTQCHWPRDRVLTRPKDANTGS